MSLQTVKSQAKYGLINKKTSSASIPQRASKVASVFASAEEDSYLENDDEEAISSGSFSRGQSEIARASKVILSSAKSTSASSLRDSLAADIDTSIYDYDGQYDDFKKESESKRSTSHKLSSNNDSKKPQYISNLLGMAQVREKEKERIFDRKLLKEREQEDAQFGDKPKFLTAAYKQKLLDEKKWEYEDKLAEKVERRTDVRGSGMTGFYANLLTKNIAMGGDVGTSSTSAYTVGNERQKRLINDEPYLSAVSESAGFNDAHISDQVKTSDDVTSTGDNISKIDDEKGAYKSGKHGRDYEDVTADSQTYPLQKMRTEEVHQKRQEVVLSARERFLARKQQQQQYES